MNKKVVLSMMLVIVAMATPVLGAYAAPPDRLKITDNTPYPVADCGAFQVINYPETTLRLTFFYDKDGVLVRVNQLWSGVDVLANSETGYAINSPFTNHAVFDVTDLAVHQGGVFWHVTVPHEGPVFFQSGHYIGLDYTDPNAELTFTGASKLDIDALCSLLDG